MGGQEGTGGLLGEVKVEKNAQVSGFRSWVDSSIFWNRKQNNNWVWGQRSMSSNLDMLSLRCLWDIQVTVA